MNRSLVVMRLSKLAEHFSTEPERRFVAEVLNAYRYAIDGTPDFSAVKPLPEPERTKEIFDFVAGLIVDFSDDAGQERMPSGAQVMTFGDHQIIFT